ncbi:hypothetical protein [Streptomyces sp. NPDC021212]
MAILDVHQPISRLTSKVFKSGTMFLLRFEDDAIAIPRNGSIFP